MRTHSYLAMVLAVVLWSMPGFAQRYLTTFGLVSDLKSAKNAQGIFAADVNGDGSADVVTYGGHQIHVNFQKALSQEWNSTSVYTDYPIARAVMGRCNADKYDDLVILTDSVPQLEVILGRQREKFYLVWKSALQGVYDDVVCADINNDKKPDILLFGKKELGITVYSGRGNGSFRKDTVLLPEYSYSVVTVSDVNADGINDIIATNWITNSVLMFTGFGKLNFSEPVEIAFPNEPSLHCVASIDNDNSKDVIVGLPDTTSYYILHGNGLGGFDQRQKIQLTGAPSKIEVEDINGDGRKDICVLSTDEQSLRVDLNDGTGVMREHVMLFAGSRPGDFALVRHRNLCHAAILDNASNRIRLLYSAAASPGPRQDLTYATGLQPYGVVVADLNHDGVTDIVTANIGSKDISVLLSNGSGGLGGSIPFGSGLASGVVKYIPRNDSVATFVATDPESENISIVEINTKNFSNNAFTLPTQGRAEIPFARIDPATNHLQFVALERDPASNNCSLVDYEQIASTRFVEKDVTPKIRYSIQSAVVTNMNGDEYPDLVFTSYDKRHLKENLYYAVGDASKQFSDVTLIRSFDVQDVVLANLWAADLNRDGRPDVVLNLRQPENTLMIFWGDKDSVVSKSYLTVHQPVNIVRPEQLQILDINGDRLLDIVCQNDAQKELQLFLRKRDGTFSFPTRLARSEGSGGFVLADLNHDKVPELIMTDRMRGTVQIISIEDR